MITENDIEVRSPQLNLDKPGRDIFGSAIAAPLHLGMNSAP